MGELRVYRGVFTGMPIQAAALLRQSRSRCMRGEKGRTRGRQRAVHVPAACSASQLAAAVKAASRLDGSVDGRAGGKATSRYLWDVILLLFPGLI